MAAITPQDRIFLERIVHEAEEDGFIEVGNRWGSSSAGSCHSCAPCICISGDRDGKVGVVLAIVLFALSSLVGLFYTATSVRSAMQAQSDLSEAHKVTDITNSCRQPQPSAPLYNPSEHPGYPAQTFAPYPQGSYGYNPSQPLSYDISGNPIQVPYPAQDAQYYSQQQFAFPSYYRRNPSILNTLLCPIKSLPAPREKRPMKTLLFYSKGVAMNGSLPPALKLL